MIAGRYSILKELGEGSSGNIFLVTDDKDKKQ